MFVQSTTGIIIDDSKYVEAGGGQTTTATLVMITLYGWDQAKKAAFP